MLVITFLQQEFVLLPELQNIDIISQDIREDVLAKFQKVRWFTFIVPPLLLILRLSLISFCLYIGSYFFVHCSGRRFSEWLCITVKAQWVILLYSIILCCCNLITKDNQSANIASFCSLLFLANNNLEDWIKLPLTAVNFFEIAYWIVMSVLVSKLVGTNFGRSFKFVMSSYGVGYLCYIVFLMFLMLYIG